MKKNKKVYHKVVEKTDILKTVFVYTLLNLFCGALLFIFSLILYVLFDKTTLSIIIATINFMTLMIYSNYRLHIDIINDKGYLYEDVVHIIK